MDRVKVLSPSISLAAHLAGASILILAPLVLPQRLPVPPAPPQIEPTWGGTRVALGGGGIAGRTRQGVKPQPRLAVPPHRNAIVPPLLERPTIDLGGGGLVGVPDDLPPGDGTGGFCLENCGSGPGNEQTAWVDPFGRPSADGKKSVRYRPGGEIREPVKVRHVAPVYPPLAIAAHVQGTVVLECMIGEDGRVSNVTVLRGNPLLEPAAAEAVREWRYLPTLLNGVRVSVLLTVTVDFRLR